MHKVYDKFVCYGEMGLLPIRQVSFIVVRDETYCTMVVSSAYLQMLTDL